MDKSTNVSINPSLLEGWAATPLNGASVNDGAMNTLANAINDVLTDLIPLARQSIIGPGATALMNALNSAAMILEFTLGCYGTGLKIIAPALKKTAQGFSDTDASLATLFNNLNNELPEFENYGTPIATFPKATATEESTLLQELLQPIIVIPKMPMALATKHLPQTTSGGNFFQNSLTFLKQNWLPLTVGAIGVALLFVPGAEEFSPELLGNAAVDITETEADTTLATAANTTLTEGTAANTTLTEGTAANTTLTEDTTLTEGTEGTAAGSEVEAAAGEGTAASNEAWTQSATEELTEQQRIWEVLRNKFPDGDVGPVNQPILAGSH